MSSSDNGRSITFGEIALALANDYDSIFIIDSEDDSYVEYLAAGDDKELVKRASGNNFYEDVIRDAREQVYPDDQDHFIASFKKENVTEILKTGRSFSLNYRLMVDGKPLYYSLKTIRGSGQKVIIGVQNVDEQRRRELASDAERITYQHIAGALAGRYEAIYYINIASNNYTIYSSSADYAKLGTTIQGEDFFADCIPDIKKFIHKEDVEYVLSELNKDTLLQHLDEAGSVSITYRQQLGGDTAYVTLYAVRPENDTEHIVMGVLNIDAQIKREQHMLEQSDMFNEVAMALASRYEAIYRVNIETDEYYEYSSSNKYTKLEVGNHGQDFFGDTQRNMKRDIYEEDYPMMAREMDKDHLLRKLEGVGKVFLNYRLMLDGRPQYMTLVIMRAVEDSKHIIVALENIDEAKRKEMEFEAAIGTAIDMANRDSLTGVKNKHAYVNAESQLDNQIADDDPLEFAIAVCDINGLKQVNDEQGHIAGDVFIKDACAIICEIFDHSPVFRIGGDEFVVILRGSDYINRHDLIKQFAARMFENKRNSLVTLAYGLAEYVQQKDNRVQDVFERADNLMYENKEMFKNLPADLDNSPSVESYSFVRFYELYEQLLTAMVTFDTPDVPLIEELLIKISTMFRLSKGVTRVYKNPQEEREGKGETLSCFDSGKEGNEILSLRVVTSVMSSATITVYMAPDEEPLSAEEFAKVELVMRTILSFVSRNRLRDIVYELAYYDEMGYPNLRMWNESMFKSLHSPDYSNLSYFRYNLRHFSLVNLEYGRSTGDSIMRSHFNNLKEMIGEDGCLTRLGGDNFIGFCRKDITGDIAQYLKETSVRINDTNSVKISASTGIFMVPSGSSPQAPGELMARITNAFFVAQSGKRGSTVYFDDSLLKRKEKIMRIQQLFPDALRKGEFRPFYQPKVNINTGELYGAEALCRWFRDGEMISPAEFIPILEQTSDICKLDIYMLEAVCRDIRRWMDEGRDLIRISVNFSRKNTMNMDLPGTISEIADRYRIPHEFIEIELTETMNDVDFSNLKRTASVLHDMGFHMSIDDFGVGYSSLNMIRDIPWNTIKIDRSYLPVDNNTDNSTRGILFHHVVSIAKQLGLECITEGVETEEQIRILRDNDCSLAQGFYYDRPLPVEDFEKRLDNRRY
ncbi:diguanylate cyclase (GGDEF) domain-containing protein [Ruminococcaceae bacterium YRB3002]|nr:diguanylate cyclase (GGDEF) domain-containing protein [Ruminococcaceae bacterium YRB3002]